MKHNGAGPSPAGGMARYLSQVDAWAIAFGCIIGWGAFVMPGTTFLPTAGPLGTIIAMLISAAIMLVIGTNYAHLMAHRPGTGGVYSYTREAFGRDHAFLCSWFLSLSYISIVFLNATALFVVSRTLLGGLMQFGLHYQVAGYDVYLSEVALSAAALVIIGWLFIQKKPLLQRVQTMLAVILLIGSMLIAIVCLPRVSPHEATDFGLGTASAPQVIATIVLLSPWAFVGFDVISLETAHFHFPVKRSGRIIALSILCGGFVYAAMSLVSIAELPDGIASWQEYIANLDAYRGVATVPTFHAAYSVLGTGGLVLMGVTALAAIFTGIIGAYRATTRVLSTMAADRILSARFSSTAFCIVFIMVISIVVSFVGRNALEWFVDLTTFGAIVGFGYTSASALRLARREHNRRVQVTGIAGTAITAAFLLVQMIPGVTAFETMGAESFLMLAMWCLIGFVFYWKTMNHSELRDYAGASTSSTVLFSLLLYSVLMWFVLNIMQAAESDAMRRTITTRGAVMLLMIFVGLVVMLYIQNLLRDRQEALEREKIHAEERSHAKSQFLFSMSHDIRTPMNAIIGFTTLARRKDATPQDKEAYLAKIERSGHQLLNVINDVLDMSRIENGHLELFPVTMNLVDTVEEIADIFAGQMAEKKLTFDRDVRIDRPWVLCDRNRLSRVLMNLLSNACKFTPDGGRVSLSARQIGVGDGKGHYELRVADSGIGMSEAFAQKVFVPFERERTSTVSGIQGTGLGLSIAKAIVDRMGGTIGLNTAPEQGTEFIIRLWLPVAEAPQEAAAAAEDAPADFSGVRLLLVEDNDVNREIALLILSQAGFSVDTAVNGREAVDKVAQQPPGSYDCVLMDVQMPEMNGYEATRAIRAMQDPLRSEVPIVAMAANAFREDVQNALEAGMNAHIAKPLDVESMMETLAKVLARTR